MTLTIRSLAPPERPCASRSEQDGQMNGSTYELPVWLLAGLGVYFWFITGEMAGLRLGLAVMLLSGLSRIQQDDRGAHNLDEVVSVHSWQCEHMKITLNLLLWEYGKPSKSS